MALEPHHDLNQSFGISDTLTFDVTPSGMTRANVRSAFCSAEFYLHGAHVTSFRPTNHDDVLWVSRKAIFKPDKAIRGGVPVCFPWFSAHATDATAPSHGWARTKSWDVAETDVCDDVVKVVLQTSIEAFDVRYTMALGTTLSLQISVRNTSSERQRFESALHSYFALSNVRDIEITGLESATFLDQLTNVEHQPANAPIRFTAETDSIYHSPSDVLGDETITIVDQTMKRRLIVERSASNSVVVWNPWIDKSSRMADFGDDEWINMCCVETANVRPHDVELQSGETHSMTSVVRVESI